MLSIDKVNDLYDHNSSVTGPDFASAVLKDIGVEYEDLTYHYDYLGERAYNEYMKFDRARRIECKTKNLFPEYKVLMSKGEL